ncbi:hypothetical protein [Senegalia massiliensis]|uniref:hypothetical protein n=1 Tax=Senegalia massiliensis TaxID=1720316 RepID=UPI0010322106|nr:hypothetical protein [Senegalia massiliensis]
MNKVEFNNKVKEIKEYLRNDHCSYDKEQIIADEIEGKLDYLEWGLDEMGIEGTIIDLETYTNDVFDKVINLVCNVLDSYKEECEQ